MSTSAPHGHHRSPSADPRADREGGRLGSASCAPARSSPPLARRGDETIPPRCPADQLAWPAAQWQPRPGSCHPHSIATQLGRQVCRTQAWLATSGVPVSSAPQTAPADLLLLTAGATWHATWSGPGGPLPGLVGQGEEAGASQ
eukprot:3050800-Rhodomonas_salina.2